MPILFQVVGYLLCRVRDLKSMLIDRQPLLRRLMLPPLAHPLIKPFHIRIWLDPQQPVDVSVPAPPPAMSCFQIAQMPQDAIPLLCPLQGCPTSPYPFMGLRHSLQLVFQVRILVMACRQRVEVGSIRYPINYPTLCRINDLAYPARLPVCYLRPTHRTVPDRSAGQQSREGPPSVVFCTLTMPPKNSLTHQRQVVTRYGAACPSRSLRRSSRI